MSHSAPAPARSRGKFWNWLPAEVDGRVRAVAWLSLIGNIVIIASGGTVRLTQSGLGCENPIIACTSSSFFASIDEGIHSIIEQSNRGIGVLLGLLSIVAVVLVWRLRASRPDLWVHAWILFGGVVVQGIVGPLSIIVDLDAWFVGLHFILSAILVGVASSFVVRVHRDRGPRERTIPVWMLALTHLGTLLLTAEVVFGVFTTGNGPHSGDAAVVRDTSAWESLVHIHAWIGYALAAVLVILLAGAIAELVRKTPGASRYAGALIAVIAIVAVQIVVGVTQARIGIPPLLVGIHMVLAAVTIALMVVLVDAVKRPVSPVL